MFKTDLRTRPIFYHVRDAIGAHPTIVLASLAITRHLHHAANWSTRKLIHILRLPGEITITIVCLKLPPHPYVHPTEPVK